MNDTHDMPGEWNDVVLPATEYMYYQGNSLVMPRASSLAAPSSASIVHVKSYHIKNLEPEAVYEAQVAARNKYGWVQPSELYSFHTRRTGEQLSPIFTSAIRNLATFRGIQSNLNL